MKELVGQTCVVEKVSDDVFEGRHPNGIQAGYTAEGVVEMVDPYILIAKNNGGYFHTSAVVNFKQIEEGQYEVKTRNSTYSVRVK